jgi:NAD(P)-dependent dehydrogenase (short-subunit alcohol dehydrogenase family)
MKIAIVTGASSGMGREFVRQIEHLYKELDEIWVIARRRERLEELQSRMLTNVRILQGDLLDVDIYEIVEKLLEAHEFAKINVMAGNITARGFATNVCTVDRAWSMGTNFNNTRNDISSICGERSAILASYNEALLRFSRRPKNKFDFKIKYLCMASNVGLDEITHEMITPCEDCLSWLNTNRYFNFNTLVFSPHFICTWLASYISSSVSHFSLFSLSSICKVSKLLISQLKDLLI